MPEPSMREWNVGADVYGRPVRLRHQVTYDGKSAWSLITEPVSQLDEGERMHSLSLDNLRQIAAIARAEPTR